MSLPTKKKPYERYTDFIYELWKNGRHYETIETAGTAQVSYTGLDGVPKKRWFIFSDPPEELNGTGITIRQICADVKKDCKFYNINQWLHNNPEHYNAIKDLSKTAKYNYLRRIKHLIPPYELPAVLAEHLQKKQGSKTVISDAIAITRDLEPRQFLHEIDISKCYWDLFYKHFGYIKQETWRKYDPYKDSYVRAIGNLSKRKIKKQFGNKRMIGKPEVKDNDYTNFQISAVVLMNYIYHQICNAGVAVYHFRTDSFLIMPGLTFEKKVKNVLEQYNLTYKITSYQIMDITSHQIIMRNCNDDNTKTINY